MFTLCLYYVITANIISNFFVMKYNLPTILLFLLSMETLWNMFAIILFYVDLSTNLCMTPLSPLSFCLFLPTYTLSLHCLTTVRCMVISVRRMVKNECQRENHFQGEINVFSTKIFENYD